MVVISWVVSGLVCVGVPFQCGYGGVVSLCSLKHYKDDARSHKHKILKTFYILELFQKLRGKLMLGSKIARIMGTGMNTCLQREERKPTRCNNIDDLLPIVDVDY